MRFPVLRFVAFLLFLASACVSAAGFAQTAAQDTAASQPVSDQVAAAEEAIANANWKAAETKLALWLTAHPDDARALFDAGYVADAQNRLDDAVGFFRRAVAANPQSFEAHIELGLILAQQGKPAEARPELAAAGRD
jgi:predicted Zn-dependent protease